MILIEEKREETREKLVSLEAYCFCFAAGYSSKLLL